jgi:hypothetical protein
MERSRLLVTDAAELPPRQATGSLITTLGRKMKPDAEAPDSEKTWPLWPFAAAFIVVFGHYFFTEYKMFLNRELFGIERHYAYVVLAILAARFGLARFRKEKGRGWLFYTMLTLTFPFGLSLLTGT